MDYLNLIENKQSELSTMFKRMDRAADMFHSRPYQVLGVYGVFVACCGHIPVAYLDVVSPQVGHPQSELFRMIFALQP
jgi:hypothetical protein